MSDDVLYRVHLRIQSASLTLREISELVGVQATDGVDVGAPVSSRRPDGPRRAVTSWHRKSDARSDDLDDHLTDLADVISGLTRLGPQEALDVDLLLMVTAAELGALVAVTPDAVRRLGAINAGIVIDAYDSE